MRKHPSRAAALLLALLCLSGCGGGGQPGQPGQAGQTGQASGAAGGSGSAGSPGTEVSVPPDTSGGGAPDVPASDAPPAPPEVTPSPEPTPEPYLFGLPVEESEEVDAAEWFADALFLGDSRTEGLQIYSGIRGADFLWHRGMTVFRVDDEDYRVFEIDGEKLNLVEALGKKQYAKVYVMIGINELGYPAASYRKGLGELLDKVKELQPGAVVYLQTLPPVNDAVAADNGLGSYICNENVNAFNEIVAKQARAHQVALLDVASVFRDEAGQLPADLAADGVHFYKDGYKLWAAYLKCHALDPASYANGVPAEEDWSPLPSPSPEPEPEPSDVPAPGPEPTDEPAPDPEPTAEPSEEPMPEPTPEIPT